MAENELGDWEIIEPSSYNPVKQKASQGLIPSVIESAKQYVPEQAQAGIRYVAGPLARTAELIGGIPGGIEQLGTSAVSAITGMEAPKFPGPLDIFHFVTGGGPLESSGHILPTPSDIQEKITKRLTGESTMPKGSKEQVYQDVLTDFMSFVPGLGASKAAGLTGIGSLLKEGTKYITGNETLGDIMKTATYLLGGTIGTRKTIVKNEKDLYKSVFKTAEGKKIDSESLNKSLENFTEQIKNRDFKGKSEIFERVNHIKDLIGQDKEIDLTKILNADKDINGWFRTYSKDAGMKDAMPWLKQLKSKIGSSISESSKDYPEIIKPYNQAKQLHIALNEKSDLTQWFNKHINVDKLKNPLVHALVIGTATSGHGSAAALGVGGAITGKHLLNALDLAMRDKTARSLYMKGIRYGLQSNSSLANKAFRSLDKRVDEIIPSEEGDWEIIS